MLEVKNLIKKYGDKTAIDGLNFKVDTGEIVGLLGLNGAGKSTTMNCITGYIAPTEGDIIIDGHDLLKEPDKAKAVIGYLPEVFSFYSDMKVTEYLDFVCDLKGFPKNKKTRAEHIEQVCKQVGIEHLAGRMIRNLSKGYKQRVGFAQALIGHPKVLILDEPTVGLDPSQIIEIRQLIRDSGRDSTVIVSSHILSEIQAICSRIIIIHGGRIVADGTPEELTAGAADYSEITIKIKADRQQAEAVLREIKCIEKYIYIPETEQGTAEYIITDSHKADIREDIFRAFADNGLPLLQMTCSEATLENAFLRLTGQDNMIGAADDGIFSDDMAAQSIDNVSVAANDRREGM